MFVDGLFEITENDPVLRNRHPSAKWVITWGGARHHHLIVRDRVNELGITNYHMRSLHTYVAFDDYEDAALALLAL